MQRTETIGTRELRFWINLRGHYHTLVRMMGNKTLVFAFKASTATGLQT